MPDDRSMSLGTIFTAKAGPLLEAIKRVRSEMEKLNAVMKGQAKAAVGGGTATAGAARQSNVLVNTVKALKREIQDGKKWNKNYSDSLVEMVRQNGASVASMKHAISTHQKLRKGILDHASAMNTMGLDGKKWASEVKVQDLLARKLNGTLKQTSSGFVDTTTKIGGTISKAKGLGGIISSLSDEFRLLGGAMKVTAAYMAAYRVFSAISDAVSTGINEIVQYDQALKNLQAITGATSREVDAMDRAMRDVARTTKFSTLETAEGMVLLAQAGFSATEAIQSIRPVATLAQGTLEGMEATTDLLTTSVFAFNLKAFETSRVADIMANAINKSKLTVDKLRVAFNYVGPVAYSTGTSIEEVAAAMMILSNSGLRASTIGTSLRQMMSRLVAPSDRLREVFEANGIAVEDMDIKTHGFMGVMKNLHRVFVDAKTGAIDTTKAFDLFGLRAANAVLALVKSMRTGEFEEVLKWTYEVGSAAAMQAIQVEGLAVKYTNLANKLKLVAIELGNKGVTGILGGFADALRNVTDGLEKLAGTSFGGFITEVGVANAAVFTLVTTLGLLAKALGWLMKSAFKIGGGILKGPGGWIIAGISTAAAVIDQLFKLQERGLKQAEKEEVETKSKIEQAHYYVGALKETYDEVSKNITVAYKYTALIERMKTDFKELAPEIDKAGGNFDKLTGILKAHQKELARVQSRAILRQVAEKPQAGKSQEFFEGIGKDIWETALESLRTYGNKVMEFADWAEKRFGLRIPAVITAWLLGKEPPDMKSWALKLFGLNTDEVSEDIRERIETAYKLGMESVKFGDLPPAFQAKIKKMIDKIRDVQGDFSLFTGDEKLQFPGFDISAETRISPLAFFEKEDYSKWVKQFEDSTNNMVGSMKMQSSKIGTASDEVEQAFRDASEKYGVSLDLIRAVAWTESKFNPKAESEKGAYGVMQLMKDTAKDMNVDMYDTVDNIMGGVKYLKKLMVLYNGDITKVLAAYHGGMGNLAAGIRGPKTTKYINDVQSLLKDTAIDLADLYEQGLKPILLKDLPEEVQSRFQALFFESTKRFAPSDTLVSPEVFKGMVDYDDLVKNFVDKTAIFVESADKVNRVRIKPTAEFQDLYEPEKLGMVLQFFPKVKMGYESLINRQVEHYRQMGMSEKKAKEMADAETKEIDRIVKSYVEMKELGLSTDEEIMNMFKEDIPLANLSPAATKKTFDLLKARIEEINNAVEKLPYPQFDKLNLIFRDFWTSASATQKQEIQQILSDMTTKITTFKKFAETNKLSPDERAEGIADARITAFQKIYKMMDDVDKYDWKKKQELADRLKGLGPLLEEELAEQKKRITEVYRWQLVQAGENAGFREMVEKKYNEDIEKLDNDYLASRQAMLTSQVTLMKDSYAGYLEWKKDQLLRDLDLEKSARERALKSQIVSFKISEDEARRDKALLDVQAAQEELSIKTSTFNDLKWYVDEWSDRYQDALNDMLGAEKNYAESVTNLHDIMYELNKKHLQEYKDDIVEMWKNGELALESYLVLLERWRKAEIIDKDEYESRYIEATGSGWDNFIYGLKRAAREVESFNDMWQKLGREIADVFTDNLTDAFEAWIDGTKSAKEAFKDFAIDTLKWIARILMKMALMRAFSSAFSGIFGGGGGGGGGGPMYSSGPGGFGVNSGAVDSMSWLHKGGVIGKDVLPVSIVNPQVFENARRLHTGLKQNEYPAILKKGEGVFTPGQMEAMGDKANSLTISVPISISGAASPQFTSRLKSNIEETVRKTLREEMR